MQKDEDVGKVAQATPVVICVSTYFCFFRRILTGLSAKALELFLQMVVTESAKVTQSRGSKKIEAYHLCVSICFSGLVAPLTRSARKHAIETTDMLDFLKDLVENVPDPSAGGTISLDGEDGKTKRGRKKAVPPPTDSDGEPPAPKVKKPRKKRVKKEQQQEVQESDHEMAEPSRSAPEENWDEDDE